MARTPELVPTNDVPHARAVALILPGGAIKSRGRYLKFADLGLRPFMRDLGNRGAPLGLAAYLLRYRVRGWNGDDADTAADTQWALAEIRKAHGDVPVVLIGNSLGGRAAFWVAGEPQVTTVVGVAPWLPTGDPVTHLAGRQVLIVQGDRDHGQAGAQQSLAYATRAREVTPDLARFVMIGENHFLLKQGAECWALVTHFVLGTMVGRPLHPDVAAAMHAPLPDGLHTPLAKGFHHALATIY
jgi:pimeloyl-ACP methyl ester carboxylesterase